MKNVPVVPNSNRIEKLRRLRIATATFLACRGMTRRELAASLGVAPSTLAGWFYGAAPAPEDLLERIAHVLSLEPAELSSIVVPVSTRHRTDSDRLAPIVGRMLCSVLEDDDGRSGDSGQPLRGDE
jgi:transcriptional regulator with XRE-family HTH domain